MTLTQMSIEEHISRLEKTLMTGRGGWIADFNESNRNVKMNGLVFDALIEGNTRMKGFLLSRLFSFLLNPNYSVSCFVLSTENTKKIDEHLLIRVLTMIRSYMKKKEIKWSWLFIFSTERMRALESRIERIDDQDVGIVFIDVKSKEVFHSNSYIGRQAKRFTRI